MNGNIDDELGLQNNDQTVGARGWMRFDMGETAADYAVTVIQGNVSGTGYANYPAGNVGQKMEWQVKVLSTGGVKWQKATAHVTVTATVARPAGNPNPLVVSWGKDVQLH